MDLVLNQEDRGAAWGILGGLILATANQTLKGNWSKDYKGWDMTKMYALYGSAGCLGGTIADLAFGHPSFFNGVGAGLLGGVAGGWLLIQAGQLF